MKKTQLYVLAAAIAAIAIAAIVYKWHVLQFPLQPAATVEVWTLQARIGYEPKQGANRVTLQIPGDTPAWSVLDERFVARRDAWLDVPSRLDGTGSTVADLVANLRALIDDAQVPLDERQARERDDIDAWEEQFGARGSRRGPWGCRPGTREPR
jgi:hypothetical protein